MENTYIYSVTGLWHKTTGKNSSDYCLSERISSDIKVVVLSDGSSSAFLAEMASKIACESYVDYIKQNYESEADDINSFANKLIEHIYNSLNLLVQQNERSISDAECTIIAAVIDEKRGKLLYFNVGTDILFRISKNNEVKMITGYPEDNKNSLINTLFIDCGNLNLEEIDKLILCTDGMLKHIYKGSSIKEEIMEGILNSEYGLIEEYISECNPIDDATLIVVNL